MDNKQWFEQPWTCGHNDPVYAGVGRQECAVCGEQRFDPEMPVPVTRFHEPPVGSWASVARMLAAGDDPADGMTGFDWDAWKDQMKDGDL